MKLHDNVALVTGEEKIKPDKARYWVSTIEAMPRDLDLSFVAVDEVQLASDFDRGHVFTDRLLNQRGRDETLLIGSNTMRPLFAQVGNVKWMRLRSGGTSMGTTLSSILMRLWTCDAFVA